MLVIFAFSGDKEEVLIGKGGEITIRYFIWIQYKLDAENINSLLKEKTINNALGVV